MCSRFARAFFFAPDRRSCLAAAHGSSSLVFSNPHCSPCHQFAPELVRLHQERTDFCLIYVGRDDAEENRRQAEEHGFQFPVVLQKRWELSKQYGIFATPIAFWIDEQGIIAKNVAQGGAEILALLPQEESSLAQ